MVHRPFQASRRAACLILPLLAGAAALWMCFAPPVSMTGAERIRMALPSQIGPYDSQVILHCQGDQCRQSFPVASESALAACPVCGGALSTLARSEREILPADTRIARRLYQAPNLPFYTVTLVQAGSDQRSIHRPQQCLPAQGCHIDREYAETLTLAGNRTLTVMVIDVRRSPDPDSRFGFAYWFVDARHETHSHYVRLFWTLFDRLFRNTASRWAYVAITAGETFDTPESRQRLAAFLGPFLAAVETQPAGAL